MTARTVPPDWRPVIGRDGGEYRLAFRGRDIASVTGEFTDVGVPGGQTLALYDAILDREPDLRHVLVRDERSAAYAADGYARVTGRAGVCHATVGPGAAKLPSGATGTAAGYGG